MYLLDSDVVTLYFHHRGQQLHLERRILSTSAEHLWISIITVEEAMQGAYNLINNLKRQNGAVLGCQLLRKIMGDLSNFQILPYDEKAKDIFKSMSAATKRMGTNDCKIAAIGIANGLTVVTRNIQHFKEIPDVIFQDWTAEKIVSDERSKR